MSTEDHSFWTSRVKATRRRVNFFIAAEYACMPVFCVACVSALLVYFLRRHGLGINVLALYILAALLLTVVVTWCLSLRRMLRDKDVRAVMDDRLGLNSALCASTEIENVKMPSYREYKNCISSRSALFFLWFVGAGALILLGFILPLPTSGSVFDQEEIAEPPAVTLMEDLLNQMEQMTGIDEESLKPFEEKLEEFKEHSTEEMYMHSSLEAADSMLQTLESSMMEFSQNLNQLDSSLGEMTKDETEQNPQAMQDMKNTLDGMNASDIKMGKELSQQLNQMSNPANMARMTPEQMQQLREQLQNLSRKMKDMAQKGQNPGDLNPNPGTGESSRDVEDPDSGKYPKLKPCDGSCGGKCSGGCSEENYGKGGVGRGRGDAPMAFKDDKSMDVGRQDESINASDYSNANLGDDMGTSTGEHDKNTNHQRNSRDAGSAGASQGGDTIWSDRLSPQERDALKHIFSE